MPTAGDMIAGSGAGSASLSADYRRKLMALQHDTVEFTKQKGGNEELLYDAFISLMGEGAAAPRRTRSWANPEWCIGQCPGCARHLRLLLVPTLDVIQCVYCTATCYTAMAREPVDGGSICLAAPPLHADAGAPSSAAAPYGGYDGDYGEDSYGSGGKGMDNKSSCACPPFPPFFAPPVLAPP